MPPPSPLTNRLKVQLKLCISRLRMVQAKDTALAKQARRTMAQLLEQSKHESARIRVENIIRSDLNTELLEILELYCELLSARVGLLDGKGEVDAGLEEAVSSIIYAAPRVEGVKELGVVRALLVERFGKEFVLRVMEGNEEESRVAKRVRDRLRVEPPGTELVEAYLEAIADAYGVDYPPGIIEKRRREREERDAGSDDGEDGGGKELEPALSVEGGEELSRATPPQGDVGAPKSPVSVVPPNPRTDNPKPTVKSGSINLTPSKKMVDAGSRLNGSKKDSKDGPGGKIPDVDELAKRFAELKR